MDADRIIEDMTMQEILAVFPRAQRALFSRYHVGGCSTLRIPTDGDAGASLHEPQHPRTLRKRTRSPASSARSTAPRSS